MNQGNFFVYKIEERRTTIDNDGNGSDAVKKPLYCIPFTHFSVQGVQNLSQSANSVMSTKMAIIKLI